MKLCTVDYSEFATLPEDIRKDVTDWMSALEKAVAMSPVSQAINWLAEQFNVSHGTARRKFDAWRNGKGHWSALINRAKLPNTNRQKVSQKLIDRWQELCAQNQRKCRPAYRVLQKEFGSNIPSYRTMMRYTPTPFELTSARIGRSAAANYRPLVYTTRKHLWVGSHYLFDDMWHDHFVNVYDTRKAGRPLEFHSMDLFSACKIAWGMKVRTKDEVTGKMDQLKESQMRFILAQVFGTIGYSERGTINVAEHGTAAIPEYLERLLYDATGGLVTVERSGMEGEPAFIGQYAGVSKGNFRFKAPMESLGNPIHNEMGFLPGQAGKDIDHRPEQLHGLLKENDALLTAMAKLSPQRAQLLKLPLLEFRQFLNIAEEIYYNLNSRIWHRLEGWENHFITDPLTGQVRRMSPLEVWDGGKNELIKLPPHIIALMLGPDLGVERRVRRHMFEFEDCEISCDLLRFEALDFKEGEKYLTVLNPFATNALYIFNARGAFIGIAKRIHSVCRRDTEALRREFGRVNKSYSALIQNVEKQGRKLSKERIARMRNNIDVLKGKPMTDEEKEDHNRIKNTKGDLEDLMERDPASNETALLNAGQKTDEFEDLL